MVMVLFGSLALAGLVWMGLAVFGESKIPTALISPVSVQTSPVHRRIGATGNREVFLPLSSSVRKPTNSSQEFGEN